MFERLVCEAGFQVDRVRSGGAIDVEVQLPCRTRVRGTYSAVGSISEREACFKRIYDMMVDLEPKKMREAGMRAPAVPAIDDPWFRFLAARAELIPEFTDGAYTDNRIVRTLSLDLVQMRAIREGTKPPQKLAKIQEATQVEEARQRLTDWTHPGLPIVKPEDCVLGWSCMGPCKSPQIVRWECRTDGECALTGKRIAQGDFVVFWCAEKYQRWHALPEAFLLRTKCDLSRFELYFDEKLLLPRKRGLYGQQLRRKFREAGISPRVVAQFGDELVEQMTYAEMLWEMDAEAVA